MGRRPSLRDVRKPDAGKAAEVAARIAGQGAGIEPGERLVTVSYNLPDELVDLLRRLARKRADEVRLAKARGHAVEGEARQSASKIVLDALLPHVDEWRRELGE